MENQEDNDDCQIAPCQTREKAAVNSEHAREPTHQTKKNADEVRVNTGEGGDELDAEEGMRKHFGSDLIRNRIKFTYEGVEQNTDVIYKTKDTQNAEERRTATAQDKIRELEGEDWRCRSTDDEGENQKDADDCQLARRKTSGNTRLRIPIAPKTLQTELGEKRVEGEGRYNL